MSDTSLCRDDVIPLLRSTFVQSVNFYDEVKSTNDEAHRRARENDPLPALFVAARQTAGRGRGANRWITSAGALTFSLLMDVSVLHTDQESWPRLSLWTALGIRSGLTSFVRETELQVKWPNDVYLRKKKVCGILIESVVGVRNLFVIGIGINVNNLSKNYSHDADLSRIAISLADVCGNVQISEVLREVLIGMELAWRSFAGSLDVRNSWEPHCMLSGRSVRWRSGTSSHTGICRGVNDDGALLLELTQEFGAISQQCGAKTIKCYGGTVSF